MQQASAKQNRKDVHRTTDLSAATTAKCTVTLAMQQWQEFLYSLRGNAAGNSNAAAELPDSNVRRDCDVWMIRVITAIPLMAVRIAWDSASSPKKVGAAYC